MMVEKYKERLGPLPGGRRGASRAGARRGSMQASTHKGSLERPNQPLPPSTSDSLVTAGPSRVQHLSPAAGGVRRMRWSKTQNMNIMRAYYGAVGMETRRTGYRAKLLQAFRILEPELTVTDQNLADRVRFILRSQIFSEDELEELRREAVLPVSSEATLATNNANVTPPLHGREDETAIESGPIAEIEGERAVSQDVERIRIIMEETILEFRDTPLEERPRIPRITLSARNRSVVATVNQMLLPYMDSSTGLGDTNSILFGAAMAVCRFTGAKISGSGRSAQMNDIPAWRRRIERRITEARRLIGKLICFRSGNSRPRVMRFVRQAFKGINFDPLQPNAYVKVTERIDDLKQKIAAWGKRIRRYTERSDRYHQNRLFLSDQKKFYWSLEHSTAQSPGREPDDSEVITFWRNIWSRSVEHDEGAWMTRVEESCVNVIPMDSITIDAEDIATATQKVPNWKTPGCDGLQHCWLKLFTTCHMTLARQFQEALDQHSLPVFMTTGVTHLAPKSNNTVDPAQYRPITCLSTTYKTLTSILKAKIDCHIRKNQIMAVTQNGCRGGSRGTKELLLIDAVISKLVKRNRRNFSAAWIDYKKAYDSVPHSWLKRVLGLYKIHNTVRNFLEACMGRWNTILCLSGRRLSEARDRIEIRRGLFQGDCLSPLWFCLALNPLSTILEASGTGFQLRRGGTRISHLFYMSDLKLFAPTAQRLQELLEITISFSSSISMALGVDKCAVLRVERGRVTDSTSVSCGPIALKTLSEAETYRYLGMSQSIGVVEADVKQSVCETFFERLNKVLNSFLSGANKVKAYNGWVMPVLIYSFGVLKWTQTELDALDRKVRTVMTLNRVHHPRSSVMRLYIPRKSGGRGLLSAKTMHNREICSLRNYFLTKTTSVMHKDVITCDKGLTPLSMASEDWREPVVLNVVDREAIWKEKELHGRFFKALHEPHVDTKASVHWLRFGDLFGETEGFVCAIQDQVIKTNNYRKYIMKDGTVDICRACHHPGESLRHVTSGCSALANTEYLHRHNQVARIIHQELALKYGLKDQKLPYYKYAPETVLENDRARLYWDRSIITDRTILANKPDIVLMDRAQSRVFLVDVTIPFDENLVKAETDKKTKYLDLAHEIKEMWRVASTEIIPIVISVNGLVPATLENHLRKLDVRDTIIPQIQKAVLLDNARIVRRFLSLPL